MEPLSPGQIAESILFFPTLTEILYKTQQDSRGTGKNPGLFDRISRFSDLPS
jgi:hypothetical protein